jgi:hypothetical protein
MKYLLTIVIVIYKSDKYISDCLNSIFNYNDLEGQLKVIVVDNSPEEFSIVNRYSVIFPEVLFIQNPSNIGFGAANNLGAAAVDSEYILFFNNDTELLEPIFKKIIAQFVENEKLGILGIRQEGGSPSFFTRGESQFIYPQLLKENKGDYDQRIHTLSGAFMFCKRDIFDRIGRFDENLFLYFEEGDILYRLQEYGYESKYDQSLHFLHKVGNRRKTNEKLSNIGSNSWCYYMKKYDIPHKRKFLNQRTLRRRKLQIYFMLKFDFREVVILQRVISYEQKLFKKTFN